MPNHVTNELKFIGKPERVKELLSKCKSENSEFSFQSFFPMPTALIGTRSPANIVSVKELKEWKEKFNNGLLSEWEKESRPMTKNESDKLIQMYGTNNWYNWRIQNWDTKWDCYEVMVLGDNSIQFDTAWSTPISVMKRLSVLFPDVKIEVRYADEDLGSNVGTYTLLNGEFEDLYQPEYSKDSLALAMDIKGDKEYWLYDRLTEVEDELSDFDHWLIEIAHDEGNLIEQYPVSVLEKLLELAIADEQYERAGAIKQLIKLKFNSENINQ